MNILNEPHIHQKFDEELQLLHNHVCKMGDLVLSQLCLALESLREKNLQLANETIRHETEVNKFEVTIDTEIFQILAKRCPIASDLRAVMTASRVVNNFERIGDEAAKIANFVLYLHNEDGHDPDQCQLADVFKLGKMAVEILRDTLSAFESLDENKASEIDGYQSGLTQAFLDSLHGLMDRFREDKQSVGNSVIVSLILKALENIGIHARDIAEGIIFQVSGKDLRLTH